MACKTCGDKKMIRWRGRDNSEEVSECPDCTRSFLTDDGPGQAALRDEICAMVLPRVEDGSVSLIQAAAACMGAAAVALGAMPEPARERVAGELADALLRHADKRAAEIRSGKFDQRFQ